MPKILIVDDQDGVRSLLQLVFLKEGFQVDIAVNGCEALQKVKSWFPDVVLMDVKMPVMDGLEALPQILAVAPSTAVIMMTAYMEPDYLKKLWLLGASDFINKPFDLEELKTKVRQVLNKWPPNGRKPIT